MTTAWPNRQRLFGLAARTVAVVAIVLQSHLPSAAYEKLPTATNLKSVYFLKLTETQNVNAQLLIGAGEADATGPEGIAHYLEHLVAAHARKVIDGKPYRHHSNAYTNNTVTNYFASGKAADLHRLIRQMSAVLVRPSQPRREMQRDRDIVAREYDFRMTGNPTRQAHERLQSELYGGHPLGRSVIGSPTSIRLLTPAVALSFHQKFYKASNATLIITGNATRQDVITLINRAFGQFRNTSAIARYWQYAELSARLEKTFRYFDTNAKRPIVLHRALFTPEGLDRSELLVALHTLNSILNSAMPGGLEGPLVFDAYLVDQLSVRARLAQRDVAEITFIAHPANNVASQHIVHTYKKVIQNLARTGLPTRTFNRAQSRLLKSALRGSTDFDRQLAMAAQWVSQELAPPSPAQQVNLIKQLEKSHLDRLVRAASNPVRSVVGFIVPKKNGANL